MRDFHFLPELYFSNDYGRTWEKQNLTSKFWSDSLFFQWSETGRFYILARKNGVDRVYYADLNEGVGVESAEKYDGMLINPNPASDYIYLNKGLQALVQREDIVIYNSMGMEAMRISSSVGYAASSASGGQMKIDVSALPSGLYFVRCGWELGKFVKE